MSASKLQSTRQIAELAELIDESCPEWHVAKFSEALTALESTKQLLLSAADRERVIIEVIDRRWSFSGTEAGREAGRVI